MKESYIRDTMLQLSSKKLPAAGQSREGMMGHLTRVISFTSGKGGVGKSSAVVNIGIALAQAGRSVLLLDADLGLANLDVLLGLQPRFTLYDLFEGKKELEEILLDGPSGISIIPAASGIESIRELNYEQRLMLMEAVENIAYGFDYLLIDTAAGIGSDVLYFNSASNEIACVISDEPTSLTDAYALIKVLYRSYGEKYFSILVNNVSDEQRGKYAFNRLANSVERFLQVKLSYLGCIPTDPSVSEAVKLQRAVIEEFPSSRAARALRRVALDLDKEAWKRSVKGGVQFFFKQLLESDMVGSGDGI